MSRLIQFTTAVNGAMTTNAQPPLLVALGLPLPKSAELPDRSPDGGATADGSPEAAVAAEVALGAEVALAAGGGGAGGGGWDVAGGAALVCAGAGTDEICEACETWETWLPVPDTWDE